MKKIIIYNYLIISVLLSCTEVIDVEVPFAGPKLVVEASIAWQKGTPGNAQTIKLSELKPYFDSTTSDIVTGAVVKVVNDSNGAVVQFADQNNGNYTTTAFNPSLNQSYTLEIVYNSETYVAREILTPVAKIDRVDQSTENGFDPNAIEVNIYFRDPIDEANYYLAIFQERKDLLPTLLDASDEFTNGNEMRIFYEKFDNEETNEKELQPGDIVDIELYGISNTYYNYIRLLIEQNNAGGDPFSTIPAPLKGNCININDPDNYALGYFRLTEVDKRTYVVE
jgi:hypothetical protein